MESTNKMGGGKAPKEYLEEKKMEEIKRHKQRTLKKYFKDKKEIGGMK